MEGSKDAMNRISTLSTGAGISIPSELLEQILLSANYRKLVNEDYGVLELPQVVELYNHLGGVENAIQTLNLANKQHMSGDFLNICINSKTMRRAVDDVMAHLKQAIDLKSKVLVN